MADDKTRRPGVDIEKYDDRGLREMLRLAAEGVEGLLMRQVPGKESELDRAIFEDVQRNRSFRFKEATGAFADAPIRFDAGMGRLDVVMNIDAAGKEAGVQFVRSGTDALLMKDTDPGSDYNRRLVEIVAQVLGLGVVEEVVFGQKLPEGSLLYLKPLPSPEDSCDPFVERIVEAIGRYKPQPIKDKLAFDTAYAKLVMRLARAGIPASRMNPIDIQSTLQQEMLRCMVKVEVWRKLWRWAIECALKVQDLRTIPAILSDKKLTTHVRDLEEGLKRAGKIVGTHAGNGTHLYERAIAGNNFYVEAMPAIVYIREARVSVETLFSRVNAWSSIWTDMSKNASLNDAAFLFQPQLATIREVLAQGQPRSVDG
jgi:hypothetical protein